MPAPIFAPALWLCWKAALSLQAGHFLGSRRAKLRGSCFRGELLVDGKEGNSPFVGSRNLRHMDAEVSHVLGNPVLPGK